MTILPIDVTVEPGHTGPAYARHADAGADLRTRAPFTLHPGQRLLVPTGVRLAIPEGYAGFIHPRSGLATNHGVTVLNAPGTIDAGYRGEIAVCLINHDPNHSYTAKAGDRIAQLIIQPVVTARFVPVHALDHTTRGTNGFGSTGVK